MFARTLVGIMGGVVIAASGAPAAAQIRGHVALDGGPIGVSVVFGSRPSAGVQYRHAVRTDRAAPLRYREGMGQRELEVYLRRIEHEYDHYRRIDGRDAPYYLSWTEVQLERYIDWLEGERRYLRAEGKRLRKLHRTEQRYRERDIREWERERRREEREWERGRRGR